MITIQGEIVQLERAARAAFDRVGYAKRAQAINGHPVEVTVSDSMINRGTATGTCVRVSWKVDGKRVAAADVIERVAS